MELMTGGELFDRICNDFPNGYSEKQSSILIKKTLQAVEYFHEKVETRLPVRIISAFHRVSFIATSSQKICYSHLRTRTMQKSKFRTSA